MEDYQLVVLSDVAEFIYIKNQLFTLNQQIQIMKAEKKHTYSVCALCTLLHKKAVRFNFL